MIFKDRVEAGRLLAEKLAGKIDKSSVVLGIPRGGVIVAAEVCKRTGAVLDVIIVRKIGAPFSPELAAAAICEGDVLVIEENVIKAYSIPLDYIEREAEKEREVIRQRELRYRGGRSLSDVRGKVVAIVDDGVATGTTVLAAIRRVKASSPRRVIVGTPVISPEAAAKLEREADELVEVYRPVELFAIGEFYEDFSQVSDEEVVEVLRRYGGAGRTN